MNSVLFGRPADDFQHKIAFGAGTNSEILVVISIQRFGPDLETLQIVNEMLSTLPGNEPWTRTVIGKGIHHTIRCQLWAAALASTSISTIAASAARPLGS